MKNLLLSIFFALLLVTCVAKSKKKTDEVCCNSKDTIEDQTLTKSCCSKESNLDTLSITVDKLLSHPNQFLNKNIKLNGLVVHTCKKSGKKMYLKGSVDTIYIKVEAGENINKFDSSLEGKHLIAQGILNTLDRDIKHHNEQQYCSSEEKGNNLVLICNSFQLVQK